ncbi:MAG: hypothetical protein J1E62_06965 [Lachnospiraceae bacterium]|nr:hypothetical protein [Lachnospiraceae bacterium]
MKQTTKQTKKLIAFLLSVALVFSGVNLQITKAEDIGASTGVTVTLRMETDADTMLAPVAVTMTEEDLNNDFGVELATGAAATYSPLRAFAKYLSIEKNVSNEDMSKYIIASPSAYGGLWVQGLSVDGDGVGAAGVDWEVSWMYSVNGQSGDVSMDRYHCKADDSVVIYGSYSHTTNPETYEYISSEYTEFNKTEYSVQAGEKLTVALNAFGVTYDDNWNSSPYTNPVNAAKVYAVAKSDGVQGATAKNATITAETNKEGKAELSFAQEGTYLLSAGKLAEDGKHNMITRPYAVVTVAKQTVQPTKQPGTTVKPSTQPKVKKPSKVKKPKAKVVKSKAKKKKVKLSWKKASNAKGYEIYVAKKKKINFKKNKTVINMTKATLKLKKGTYFIKIRAYNKSGKVKKTGAFSSTIKVKVK